MAWVLVVILNGFGNIWPSRRVGNFGYTIWMVATMLGLLASCSLGNDLRCYYSIEMPSLLKRMNQTQLPSMFFFFDFNFITMSNSFYVGESFDGNNQSVDENNETVGNHWLYHFIDLSCCALLCKSFDY